MTTLKRLLRAVVMVAGGACLIGAFASAAAAGLEPEFARSAVLMWFVTLPLLVLGAELLFTAVDR